MEVLNNSMAELQTNFDSNVNKEETKQQEEKQQQGAQEEAHTLETLTRQVEMVLALVKDNWEIQEGLY